MSAADDKLFDAQLARYELGPGADDDLETQGPWIDHGPTFLGQVDPPLKYIINELIPSGVIALLHGEPRTRKSWAALDIAIAASAGLCAFGLSRFLAPEPAPTLYSSQEDAARLVRLRCSAMLKGRGIDCPPLLSFAVHKGISLEQPAWHELLIKDILAAKIRLVIFDPVRRFAANADNGPADVRAITGYLRRLTIATGATVLIVHHDVKPPSNGVDNRRRGHKASGGDWFAASEAPIGLEVVGDSTMAYPESYKLSADPEPFSFIVKTDDSRYPTVARINAETTTAADAGLLAIDEAVLLYLTGKPGATGYGIIKGTKKSSDVVRASLDRLFSVGKIDCKDGPRNSQIWFKPT